MVDQKYYLYKLTSPNGKVYIGITGLTPELRWKSGHGYKGSHRIYNAILKYGWDNFKHEIIMAGLTKEQAELNEIQQIKQYNSTNDKYGYNIENGGNACGSHSEQTKEKISRSNKGKKRSKEFARDASKRMKGKAICLGRKHTEESKSKMRGKRECMAGSNNPKSRRVLQFDKLGVLCNVYESATAAEKILTSAKHTCNISKCCRGVFKTAYGYVWKYVEDCAICNM